MKNLSIFISSLLLFSCTSAKWESENYTSPSKRVVSRRPSSLFSQSCVTAIQNFMGGGEQDIPEVLTLLEVSGKRVNGHNIKMGERLGHGGRASIYHIKELRGDSLPTGIDADDLVLKLAFFKKKKGLAIGNNLINNNSKKAIEREYEITNKIFENIGSYRTESHHPTNPAWNEDALPILPILSKLETEKGPALLKFKVKGKSFDDIVEHLKENRMKPEWESGLKDIYQWLQSVYHRTGINIDAAAHNLMWVEDPVLLNKIGYSRPGFVMFEADQTVLNQKMYIMDDADSTPIDELRAGFMMDTFEKYMSQYYK